MSYTNAEIKDKVLGYTKDAAGICWDGCHKVYILMDQSRVDNMTDLGYDVVPGHDTDEVSVLADLVTDWYQESCGLRFINAIRTVSGDPNKGFTQVIAQFEDEDDDD